MNDGEQDILIQTGCKVESRKLFSTKRKNKDMLAVSPAANVFLNLLMVIVCLLALIPIYVIVISSVTSEAALTANGYRLWPEEFSTMAYTFLFSQGSILITAYKNTIISTAGRHRPGCSHGGVVCLRDFTRQF